MANTAESETFAVELLSIARDVPITTEELFEDDTTTLSTLLFFAVSNTTERPMRWWYDEHHVVGSDGFQYPPGQNIDQGVLGTPEELPAYWELEPTVQPGTTARCVSEVPDLPTDVDIETVIYDYGPDRYEITADESALKIPPF